jgi:hypothetical protein
VCRRGWRLSDGRSEPRSGVVANRSMSASDNTRSYVLSLRIVNVLSYEISLETGFHGQVVTDPACPETCGWLPHPGAPRTHRCGQSRHGCRTLAPDTGHRHRTPDTGHRTRGHRIPTGRRSLDGRTLDMWTLTETRTGRPRHGGIRTSWHHDAAGTADRVAMGHTRRSATMTARR